MQAGSGKDKEVNQHYWLTRFPMILSPLGKTLSHFEYKPAFMSTTGFRLDFSASIRFFLSFSFSCNWKNLDCLGNAVISKNRLLTLPNINITQRTQLFVLFLLKISIYWPQDTWWEWRKSSTRWYYIVLIYYQILTTNIERNVWRQVRRILAFLLRPCVTANLNRFIEESLIKRSWCQTLSSPCLASDDVNLQTDQL